MTLPLVGEISYSVGSDTYSFGSFAKSRLRMDPVPSRSRTTTRGVKYTLTVDDIVFSAGGVASIAEEMGNWTRILTTRCGRLIYSGRGHDLDVNNPSGTVRDIGGSEGLGPIPHLSEMKPLSGSSALAAKVSWSCSTIIPICDGTTVYTGHASDFSYEIGWHIDDGGRQTRTITGIVEYPVTRLNNQRKPTDQADAYRDRIENAFPMIPGFKRTRDFKLSDDRRTEAFTYVDREVAPTAFQVGIEEWHGEQSTRSTMAQGFKFYANRISTSFQVQRDKPKAIAWERFGAIVAARILEPLRRGGARAGLNDAITKGIEGGLMPLELDVRDTLNSQEVSFSFSYKHTSSPVAFLSACGMWDPLPNGKWEDWHKGAAGGVARERGYVGMAYSAASDAIIDLCAVADNGAIAPPQPFKWKLPPVPRIVVQPGAGLIPPPKPKGQVKGFRESRPPRELSFLAYEAHLRFTSSAGIARHKPLHYAPTVLAFADVTDKNVKTHLQQGSAPPDVLQSVSSPTSTVILYGSAVRAGYAVVPPKLVEVGGVRATLVSEDIDNAEIGNGGGVPIFGGRWQCVYLLQQTPMGNIPVPEHQFFTESKEGPDRV